MIMQGLANAGYSAATPLHLPAGCTTIDAGSGGHGALMHFSRGLIVVLALMCLLPAALRANEFVFARMMYGGGGYDSWPRWQADWPEAETHFSAGLDRLTSIDVAEEDVLVRMAGNDVFDFPWIYVVEVGFLSLSVDEIEQLREYLLRGGFLMVDDFHGHAEWQQFEYVMEQVFPDRAIEELPGDSEIFHVMYDLTEREQIPGIRAWLNNQTWEKGGRNPHWRGIVDDQGRVMVAVNFNQDIGDAWEHADDARYPARLTTQAYRLGINYVVYALTH